MGRQSFYNKVQSSSMDKAYRNACADAKDEHGHEQGYSGQINATNGYTDRTSHFKASGLSINEYMNKHENNYDNEACGICIKDAKSNTNKIKSVVKHEVFKGTRKWELTYVVETKWGDNQIGSKDNKADAVTLARKHTETTQEGTVIRIERKLVGSNSRVATIEYKGSTNEQQGTYVFFGLARC
jgi:hypothetical protein